VIRGHATSRRADPAWYRSPRGRAPTRRARLARSTAAQRWPNVVSTSPRGPSTTSRYRAQSCLRPVRRGRRSFVPTRRLDAAPPYLPGVAPCARSKLDEVRGQTLRSARGRHAPTWLGAPALAASVQPDLRGGCRAARSRVTRGACWRCSFRRTRPVRTITCTASGPMPTPLGIVRLQRRPHDGAAVAAYLWPSGGVGGATDAFCAHPRWLGSAFLPGACARDGESALTGDSTGAVFFFFFCFWMDESLWPPRLAWAVMGAYSSVDGRCVRSPETRGPAQVAWADSMLGDGAARTVRL